MMIAAAVNAATPDLLAQIQVPALIFFGLVCLFALWGWAGRKRDSLKVAFIDRFTDKYMELLVGLAIAALTPTLAEVTHSHPATGCDPTDNQTVSVFADGNPDGSFLGHACGPLAKTLASQIDLFRPDANSTRRLTSGGARNVNDHAKNPGRTPGFSCLVWF